MVSTLTPRQSNEQRNTMGLWFYNKTTHARPMPYKGRDDSAQHAWMVSTSNTLRQQRRQAAWRDVHKGNYRQQIVAMVHQDTGPGTSQDPKPRPAEASTRDDETPKQVQGDLKRPKIVMYLKRPKTVMRPNSPKTVMHLRRPKEVEKE